MTSTGDLTAKVFTRLTVISEAGRNKEGTPMWLCKCVCGNTATVRGNSLRSGATRSCGCLRKDSVKGVFTTHGLSGHPLYSVWVDMKSRCSNNKCKRYKDYGGKGISVCDAWSESFEAFYKDVVHGYEKGLQLDRIDNDGDYTPSNVRWVTPQQNLMNRGGSRHSTSMYKGVSWHVGASKWVAQIRFNGKTKHLGCFLDELEAAQAYNDAADNLFREYANLNKIEDKQIKG